MIIRIPHPRTNRLRQGTAYLDPDDIWEMTFQYQCSACVQRWSMAEEDKKPEFCPYCGEESNQ